MDIRKSPGRAPWGAIPGGTLLPAESTEPGTGLPTGAPNLLSPASSPLGALGFASGAAPGAAPAEGLAAAADGLAVEAGPEAQTDRASQPLPGEARPAQPGLPQATAGAESAAGEALQAIDAAGEPDADPRLEASRREAPVREANARANEVDTQRALRAIEQVRVQLRPGQRAAEIQLAPAELGRLAIRLKVERGNVHAVVRVEQPETLAALERFLPELRAALSAQGLDVGGMDLGLAGDANGAFSEALDDPAPRTGGHPNEPDPAPALERRVNLPALGVSEDAVDTFA